MVERAYTNTEAIEASLLAGGGPVNPEHRAREERLAGQLVRRQVNQHGCSGTPEAACGHPDHRRDRFYAAAMLEALGVPPGTGLPTAEDYELYLRQEVAGPRQPRSPGTSYRSAKNWGPGVRAGGFDH